ncbi:MAG: glycosyltransferase, partial [Planctomycetota bacterium]
MTRPTPRKLKIVCYAINGSGVGHVTRLVAIARWLRRYLTYLGIQPEIYFLSSSEASTLLFRERFACFKVPSKTTVREAGIPKTTYLALAKQWVWNSLGLIRPDLFIVDTFPGGSFGELLNALDLCRTKAFIYRPLKADFARSPGFQAMLPLYDAVIVPAKKDNAAALPVPARARAAVSYTGPIIVRDRAELADRAAARARLGVPHDRLAVYISAGGGGDENSEAQLRAALSAIADDPRLHAVVGAGPLFRGQRPHRANVTWLAHEQAVEVMPGFDLAVAACGYNTFHELMLTGVPTVFLPQPKIADQQDLRAEQAARAGAAALLGPRPTAEAIRAALAPWLDDAARAEASAAARALVPRSHARDAAQELLRLVLPGSVVEAAEEALTEELVAS